LFDKIFDVMSSLDMTWELIFCDDGSTDSTWAEIEALNEKNGNVLGIRLSRNFGHQQALIAGLTKSSGRAVITMDADHQHPPSLLPDLIKSWKCGNKIVHALRLDPKSLGFFKKLSSRLYYRIYSFLCGVKLQPGMADFRLLDRQVINDLLEFKEEGLFLRGMVQWVGYKSDIIPFTANARMAGQTKYSVSMMFRFAWTGITSFSIIPLRLGIFLGLLTSFIAFCGMFYAIWARYYADVVVPGWASALSVTSFLFGILFILLGIIGDYIGRILMEVKARPRYLVSESLGGDIDERSHHDPK